MAERAKNRMSIFDSLPKSIRDEINVALDGVPGVMSPNMIIAHVNYLLTQMSEEEVVRGLREDRERATGIYSKRESNSDQK